MEKSSLEQFTQLVRIFNNNFTDTWLYCLANGDTYFYPEHDGIVNILYDNDICCINSGTYKNKTFSKSMIKRIINTVKANDKVILQSTNKGIVRFCEKMGGKYNSELKMYSKGV